MIDDKDIPEEEDTTLVDLDKLKGKDGGGEEGDKKDVAEILDARTEGA